MSLTLSMRSHTARCLIARAGSRLELSIVGGTKCVAQLAHSNKPRSFKTLPISQNTSQRTIGPRAPTSYRSFSESSSLYKKKTKADREAEAAAPTTETEDPFDFSILENSITKTLDKLKDNLSKLRTGGRFNPEALENVRVQLDKKSKKTERLGDLAQVLPKTGRSLAILVGEKDHVHAIVSAIQANPELNLQPQIDAENPVQLNVPIPPPTKESRDAALKKAAETGEVAKTGVQSARAVCQKRLRGMEVKKVVRPDDLKKAGKKMEGIVEKGVVDVKKMVEVAKKGMEQA